MIHEYVRSYPFAGFKAKRNFYNHDGTLIIAANVVLTPKQIDLLEKQGIYLKTEDVTEDNIRHIADHAIAEIKEVFAKVRSTKRIPFKDVQEKIMPSILQISQHPSLQDVLNYLEQKDEYTYRHSISVALFSRMIGKAKGMSEQQLLELTTAGFLHDIGKARIPEEIINKPGKLSDLEYEMIKNHAQYGYDMIKSSKGFSDTCALVALQHHEREDGSGYPKGLTENEIHEYSKIVAVADVFHAMISNRAYKQGVPFYKVLHDMSEKAFGLLEPQALFSFVNRIMEMLINCRVTLSNGNTGKIISIHKDDPLRPLVKVGSMYIDLKKVEQLYIDRIGD